MASRTFERFSQSLVRVSALISASDKLRLASNEEADDVLRSCLVLIVSALDFYIHEIVRAEMVDIFAGNKPKPNGFDNYTIALKAFPIKMDAQNALIWFESELKKSLGFKSFQMPDNVAAALKMIRDLKDVWGKIGFLVSVESSTVQRQLSLLVRRRNCIAHEADRDDSFPDSIYPILRTDVQESMVFIRKICEAIDSLVFA